MNERCLHLTSGRGPTECEWAAASVLIELSASARDAGIGVTVLARRDGEEPETLRSALLLLTHADDGALEAFSGTWVGTVQWVGASPYRPNHRRRNWFVSLAAVDLPADPTFDERDLRITPERASGPGGQHSNRSSSAIRAVHVPTGLTTIARDQRSQHQNRRLALSRLAAMLAAEGEATQAGAARERWAGHDSVVRGNPVRVLRAPIRKND